MRRARTRRLAGATVGVLTFGAAMVFPRALGDEASSGELAGDPCGGGDPAGWVERVDARLELRMPALGEGDRRRLARTLVTEAWDQDIDPLLVLAVIEVESSYDLDAVSPRGARGLMQLREPTLKREVARAGLAPWTAGDPAVNVRAGIRYLRRLLDAFGREETALMAYNAGPNRILGYLRAGEIPDRFRTYPRKVKAELRRLRRSFGMEQGPALALARSGAAAPAAVE